MYIFHIVFATQLDTKPSPCDYTWRDIGPRHWQTSDMSCNR